MNRISKSHFAGKVLAFILAFSMLALLCACGESKESIEDKVKSAVDSRAIVYVKLMYETSGLPTLTHYIDEIGDNTYKVTGKVTVRDNYGDSFTGKYDAEVTYDPETEECNCTSFDLETPTKDR